MGIKKHSKLWLYFTGLIFATVTVMIIAVTLAWVGLFEAGMIHIAPRDRHIPILICLIVSVVLGVVTALFVGKLIIKPVLKMGNAFDELSKGNFDCRVPEDQRIVEMKEMAVKFNAMAHDLSNIETLRNDFVVNVSHEFKTPLSSIEGYATLLQNQNLTPDKSDHYVKKILDNSRRLSHLASNILMLSKLENQNIVTGNTEFRLDEQIRKTILSLEDKWEEKDLEFDMELPVVMLVGNEALLERVWSNIIDNAIKHSPYGGVIGITMENGENKITVTVKDNGDGMDDEVQKHIFEKFYQGDSSRKEEGNGLGLALVKKIVEISKGDVTVSSKKGEGAAFTVILSKEG